MSRHHIFATAFSIAAATISTAAVVVVASDRQPQWGGASGLGATTALSSLADSRTRVMFPIQINPNTPHPNTMISLAHNWDWGRERGWVRDDPGAPSVALTMETWFHGLSELNFDMLAPGEDGPWPGGRGMGFAARHDGTFATLMVGGEPYSPGAAGVQFTGGHGPDPVVTVFETERHERGEVLRVQRAGGGASVVMQGGVGPGLAFGLAGRDAGDLRDGVIRVVGDAGDSPVLNISGAGSDAAVLAVRASETDQTPNLRISSGGAIEWSDGRSAADVAIARSGPGQLAARGELVVNALRVGRGATLQAIQTIPNELTPPVVPARSTTEHVVTIPGLVQGGLFFVNGPRQPAGIAVAGARPAGPDRVAIQFINTSDAPLQPTAGGYWILAIEAAER